MAAVGDCGASTPAFPLISAAVTAATAGDTIVVCPGTYPESVLVNKTLTILGPNAGVTALAPRGPEAHITSAATTVLIQSPDVTVDGFKIDGDFGVYIDTAATGGISVANNDVTGSSWALGLVSGPGDGYSFEGNVLASPVRNMHLAAGPYQNVALDANRFSGTGTIFYNGNSAITGFDFTSNEVLNGSNNMAARIEDGDVGSNLFAPSVAGGLALQIDLHNSTVTDNTFDGNDTNRCLQLYGVQFGLDPSTDVLVSENQFTDCGGPSAGAMWALQLSEGVDGIDISNNDFSNTKGDAVNTRLTGWTLNADIHVNFNNITGSTGFGINNTAMGTLDGECNWWGAANGPGPVGPGSGDRVSTGVDYTPWLVAPAPGGSCTGTPPNPPPSKDACKKDGWMAFTDDQNRPFKNQGDCVSYFATGGKNKAAG
jgi:nitrous oxidase accessory protein NosD